MVSFEGVDLGGGIHPLPILAEGLTPADWGRLKAGVESLGLDFPVRPVAAKPGSPGVILALGGLKPSWGCYYAPVTSTESPGLSHALRCVLTGEKDERIVDRWLEILTDVFGPEVIDLGMVEVKDA